MNQMTSRPRLGDDRNSRSQPQMHHSVGNVFHLLALREVSPRTKCWPKRRWGKAPKHIFQSGFKGEAVRDARRSLLLWLEAESLRHLSGEYSALVPPPRSTIAATFSNDGKRLASTHGDHTVKIIDCQRGHCLKVLYGHRRTPWVVRFHPRHPAVLASGSLDHEVRLWDANTSECIGSRNFYRPIASLAFHAEGELLAVASGHKLYLWLYNQKGEASSPAIVLKTKRSLRAVHFHPHGAPFLLTAEVRLFSPNLLWLSIHLVCYIIGTDFRVNDLDSSDPSVAKATSLGCLHYPPPAVYMANVHSNDRHSMAAELPLMPLPFLCPPSFARDDLNGGNLFQNTRDGLSRIGVESSALMQFQMNRSLTEQNDHSTSPMETSPFPNTHSEVPDILGNYPSSTMQISIHDIPLDTEVPAEVQHAEDDHHSSATDWDVSFSQSIEVPESSSTQPDATGLREHGNLPTSRSMMYHNYPSHSYGLDSSVSTRNSLTREGELPEASFLNNMNRDVGPESFGSGDHSFISAPEAGPGPVSYNNPREGVNAVPIISRIESELSLSLAATTAAELPCTVKLRIWPHDIEHPCAPLSDERFRLAIPHVVLCSEMGAHFSPCGKYLAACVACVLPEMETDPGLVSDNQDALGSSTSPTGHPISARQIIYELRIYSLEEPMFGSVLVSRAIRAAHCLTSIQFSPTSEHILLSYGRRHCSLLKSIVINGEASVPIYTVLEVYRVSDLEIVSVLPSAQDEVNVASFHPLAGGGLVYGTKEGKLRVLQCDRGHCDGNARSSFFPEASILQVEKFPSFQCFRATTSSSYTDLRFRMLDTGFPSTCQCITQALIELERGVEVFNLTPAELCKSATYHAILTHH